jgi:hypothetical protein
MKAQMTVARRRKSRGFCEVFMVFVGFDVCEATDSEGGTEDDVCGCIRDVDQSTMGS